MEILKHGKRPTKKQKIRINELGFNSKDWLIVKDCNELFVIVNKQSNEIREFEKECMENEK